MLLECIETKGHSKVNSKRIRLRTKFNNISSKKPVVEQLTPTRNFVVNRSSKGFNEVEIILLNEGLKYKPKPLTMPIDEIVVYIKPAIQYMPNAIKLNVRMNTKKF